ncbi:MAG: hypothetical protein DLM64_09985 [Solirubrobacterales bacterium]|nr:MAG: hypothetical protein DLM64_09985 [Solirubrobacterales bacterium]
MTVLERFEQFFRVVNGGAMPYPWQRSLVDHVARTGRWPEAITAPTGSGKSSVVDIHVFLVAEHARQAAATVDRIARPPRRLVLVAPRRVLVDDQFERATRLAARLCNSVHGEDAVLEDVAAALRGLVTMEQHEDHESPLGVSRLRGGVLLDYSWRLDPAQCQVICATPQMWGSRLLLRGYRGSRRSRNLEAGLLGHDAVAIVDEAHLHERLVETATRVAAASPSALGLQVLAMSATRAASSAHTLTPADLADGSLQQRVCAGKQIDRAEVEDWKRDARAEIVTRARDLHGDGTVGVFVNTVQRALDVAADLRGTDERTVALVCGRLRPADLDRLREQYVGLLDARGNVDVDYLVTTQSLEVGVDLDLPAMVSEIAPSAALAQRAGRLNRSGSRLTATFSVVCPAGLLGADPDELGDMFKPYSARDIVDGARWLDSLGGDAAPRRISATPLPAPPDPPLPLLSHVDLQTLAMTGEVLGADIDVPFYVEEPRDAPDDARVSIGARAHLDLGPMIVRQALLVAPPRAHELASMRLGTAFKEVLVASPGSWVVRTSDGVRTTEPIEDPEDAQPGDVIVVPAGSEICTRGVIGLVGKHKGDPIDDVIDARRDGAPDAMVRLAADEVGEILADDPVLAGRAARRALAAVVATAGNHDLAARLRTHRYLSDLEVTWCHDPESADGDGLLVVLATEHDGRLPIAAVSSTALVTVDAHSLAVEARMAAILEALDAADLRVCGEQLLAAALTHDEGKRHPRFQRRMGALPDEPPLAKPRPGHVADRGDGWRHEQLSAAVAAAQCHADPLVVSVVAAHHGHGRTLFNRDEREVLDDWSGCEDAVVLELQRLFGAYGRYELERSRLQRELGVHRLAFLEALLRCADIQVSREGG